LQETEKLGEEKKEVGLAEKEGEKTDSDAPTKPDMCTADELHYVPIPGTDWRLALWRYLPSKNAVKRKHPVMMLSGIATNAYCFDLAPNVSLARYLADAGFDTWILEVRGAGLSKREGEPTAVEIGGAGGALSGVVEDTVVGAAIKGAAKATPHMEKHIEERHLKKGDGPVTASPKTSTSSNGSSDSSFEYKRPPFTNKNIESRAEDTAESAMKGRAEKEPKKEQSWLTSAVSSMTERYKRLVRVNQSYLLSHKYVNKVMSFLDQGYLKTRVGGFQESLKKFLDGKKTSGVVTAQLSNATKSVGSLFERGQRSVSPTVSSLQERLNTTVGSVQDVIELVSRYDWDFDNYLEEDVPAAMDYVKSHTHPPDGKIFGLGHSMGGIILYAMLGTRAEHGLKAAVTVASSLEYGMSDSSLKLLIPFASPAQLLNIPVVPLGVMMSAVTPLISKAPYPLAWIGYHVSAKGMMDEELFQKLVLTNFCTIPMKLLHQLKSAFDRGGLQNRDGSVSYKDLLKDCEVPVMAIAGDRDLICPPSAVIDTVEVFPNGVTYKEFGDQERHYSHYDLLCGRTAKDEVYPEVRDFLIKNDE
jgi:pimeloyl-ACP methyl ester carboxylesterase